MSALLGFVTDHYRALLIGAGAWTLLSVAVALVAGRVIARTEDDGEPHLQAVRRG